MDAATGFDERRFDAHLELAVGGIAAVLADGEAGELHQCNLQMPAHPLLSYKKALDDTTERALRCLPQSGCSRDSPVGWQ